MTNEEALAIFEDNDTVIENPNYLFTEIAEAWDIAIKALKERLAIDHETMRADFGEVELRGLEKMGDDDRNNIPWQGGAFM